MKEPRPESDPPSIDEPVERLRRDGYMQLDQVVDPALVTLARTTFLSSYDRLLTAQEHRDALLVGPGRHMITVRIDAPFSDPQLLANATVLPILEALLGDDCVLGNFGVVCSLPGAQAQHIHRDGGVLFPESPMDDLLPAAAIVMGMPLLEMNDLNGTTALVPGSHRRTKQEPSGAAVEPRVSEGSCLLWDYRLLHAGTANRSSVPRPLLYATYSRPWFVDHHNFSRQEPLSVAPDADLSPELVRLLARERVSGQSAG